MHKCRRQTFISSVPVCLPRVQSHLYLILLNYLLLLTHAAWMHAGCAVSPSQGIQGELVSFMFLFTKLRISSGDAAQIKADLWVTHGQMYCLHLKARQAQLSAGIHSQFSVGHVGHAVTVSLTIPLFI